MKTLIKTIDHSFWSCVGATIFLLICLVIVTYPRFNRHDIGILKESIVGRGIDGKPSMGDAPEYMRYVSFFRGETSRQELTTPFAYRPGVPYLASLLPVRDPMTALNSINLAALALAMLFLHGMLRTLGYGFWAAITGNCVFVLSFPVFYYGTVGLVDPVFVACLAGGLICLYRQQWGTLCIMVMLGTLVKETMVVMVVVTAAYLLVTRPAKRLLIITAVALAFILPTMAVRLTFGDLDHYVWHPSMGYLKQNLRFRAIIAIALSFGIPGFLTLFWMARRRFRRLASPKKVVVPMMIGNMCLIGLSAFAFVAAYADGRYLWGVSIFGIPFCLDVLWCCRGNASSRTIR